MARVPDQKRQRRSWYDERHSRAANLGHGPLNPEDLGMWPLHVVQALTKFSDDDKEVEFRLQSHCLNGLNVYTDYSGIDWH